MPPKRWQLTIKHMLDRLLAAILLLVLVPVFLMIGILVRWEDGQSVFFKQYRMGKDNKPFVIWKFRTMVVNADQFLDERGGVNGNSRVTRVGRYLRATSLDELPQLINILRGEMSFVGPRPGLVEHFHRYTDAQKGRYRMRPGVTGLAQISGRNTLPWSYRIAYDLEYISTYSLWLDLKICFKTIAIVLAKKGLVLDRNPEQVDDLRTSETEGTRKNE